MKKSIKIIAYLPCRKGSQRVKNKNTRDFASVEGGLTRIKINQLINTESIDKIVVSTDDEIVRDICNEELSKSSKPFEIVERPANLASSETSTDDLINYVPNIIKAGHVLWTHVTSPFLNEKIYERAINIYKKTLQENQRDSLVSVTKHQKFFWDQNGDAVNYDRKLEKWPRTQTMSPLYELNSGIFLADIEIYRRLGDRIGDKPFMFEISNMDAMDIDWEDDFIAAEQIWKYKNTK